MEYFKRVFETCKQAIKSIRQRKDEVRELNESMRELYISWRAANKMICITWCKIWWRDHLSQIMLRFEESKCVLRHSFRHILQVLLTFTVFYLNHARERQREGEVKRMRCKFQWNLLHYFTLISNRSSFTHLSWEEKWSH